MDKGSVVVMEVVMEVVLEEVMMVAMEVAMEVVHMESKLCDSNLFCIFSSSNKERIKIYI